MDESDKHLGTREALEGRWQPEEIPEQRLKALLPYTGASSVSELQAILGNLGDVLSRLSPRARRHKFAARKGGPTKTEYVLYAGGDIVGRDFAKLESWLENLGIRTQPIDVLDREFVVSDEVSKVRLEILGLVLGHDPDSEMRAVRGDNWNAAVESLMERAAVEESFDDIPLIQRSHRSFPLKGSTQLQKLGPALRAHFMDALRVEVPEDDPVELDVLIDDTASRFEGGSISLDQAFVEWGIDVEESVEDHRTRVPAGKPLGEVLEPTSAIQYRWKDGKLFRRGKNGFTDAAEVSPQEIEALYARAKPAAELLWDADHLSRRAAVAEERGEDDLAARLRQDATHKRDHADGLPDSLAAIKEVIQIHSGYVFRRVMRFLKRRDVRMASTYGPHDLMQEGLLGLYRAIARYEESGPASFIGYARFHINGMMLRYAEKHRSFAILPVRVQSTLNQLYDIDDKADTVPENGGQYALSPDARAERRLELARRIFGDTFDITSFLDKKRRETHHEHSSYTVPISEIDAAGLDAIDMRGQALRSESGERLPEIADTKRYLSMLLLQILTPREEAVIRARYGLGGLNEVEGEKTLEETAARVGRMLSDGKVSRERIRQIEMKALRKLKQALYVRFGRYKYRGDGNFEKYIDLAAVARVFDIEGFR